MGARTAARVLTYGFADDADVGAEAVTSAGLDGMTFTLRLPGRPVSGHDPGARAAVRPQRRWPPPRSAWPPACPAPRSSTACAAAGPRRTASSSSGPAA